MALRGEATVPVWDVVVRGSHWAVAALVFFDYWDDSGGPLHRWLGYIAAALVLLRLLWAGVGSRHARFESWWPSPARLREHLAALRAGRASSTLGHNPLGALMMLALWSLILALAVTGWMSRLDAFWGDDGIKDIHAVLADTLIALVGVHIVAALVMSRLHGENLVLAMVTGRKRAPPRER
jgi:cytochrome b